MCSIRGDKKHHPLGSVILRLNKPSRAVNKQPQDTVLVSRISGQNHIYTITSMENLQKCSFSVHSYDSWLLSCCNCHNDLIFSWWARALFGRNIILFRIFIAMWLVWRLHIHSLVVILFDFINFMTLKDIDRPRSLKPWHGFHSFKKICFGLLNHCSPQIDQTTELETLKADWSYSFEHLIKLI